MIVCMLALDGWIVVYIWLSRERPQWLGTPSLSLLAVSSITVIGQCTSGSASVCPPPPSVLRRTSGISGMGYLWAV